MTPQHRLAIEIMFYELGLSPHEIVADDYWPYPLTLKEIETTLGMDSEGQKRKNNHFLTFDGKTRTLMEWSRVLGIHPDVISKRLKRGLTVREALTLPLRVTKRTRIAA